jgi:hypothetical protein
LTAALTDTVGNLTVIVQDDSVCLPVHCHFMVLEEAIYDSLFAAAGTDYLPVDAVQISSDTTAADNLESACDNYSATRGLAGTALPAAAADAAGGLPISDLGGLDLDAKVGALTFTVAGDVDVNVQSWLGQACAAVTTNGVPEVDVTHWLGTAAATPTVAGVPEVDVTHWIGTAAATPTGAGVPEVDVTHIAGAAVSAASAQLGVNVVQMSGSGPAADNLETAALAYSVTRGLSGTALPAAAADAAGGLPISDAGGLDLDGLVAATVLAILKTDWTGITGEADRSVLNALRFLRNKWSITGTTLTVLKEDDSTSAWTAALTTDAAATPITGSDPAGP